MPAPLENSRALLASLLRSGAGAPTASRKLAPEKPLHLYEFEACPFCRKAREALSALRLDYISYPCPKGGQRYRPWVKARGGVEMFPFLIDPNSGAEMYQSADIVRYLFKYYGVAKPPLVLRVDAWASATSWLASVAYPGGRQWRPAKQPNRVLELIGHEADPGTRRIRARLCAYEIAYLMRPRARDAFRQPIPALSDPNRDREVKGAVAILDYLAAEYGLGGSG